MGSGDMSGRIKIPPIVPSSLLQCHTAFGAFLIQAPHGKDDTHISLVPFSNGPDADIEGAKASIGEKGQDEDGSPERTPEG